MTPQDVQKMIDDQLGKLAAERAAESADAAAEKLGKTVRRPDDITPDVMAAAAKAGTVELPRAKRLANGMVADPLQGKGLDFARLALCTAFGQRTHEHPKEWAKRLGFEGVQKALSESSFADGGALVPDQISGEFIELLRSATVCLELGARSINFKGSLTIGRQNAAATASWVGEQSNISNSSPTFGQLQLQAKKLAALVPISNDLMRNPAAGVEALVRDDLLKVMALKLDLSMLEGTGSSYSPRGLDSWIASANSNAITGTALSNKVDDLTKLIRLVEQSDVAITRGGFVMHPRTKWALMSTLDSQGNFVFMQEMLGGSLFGYPFKTKSGLTASSSNYKIYFGEWPEMILGVDTAMEVVTEMNAAYYNGSSVTAGLSTDESAVRAIGRFDVVVRNTTSFSQATSVSY